MKIEKIGRILTLLFVAILPWDVILSVFGTEEIHLGLSRYFKELFLVLIGVLYLFEIVKRKVKISFDRIDVVIIAYIGILLLVSLWNGTSLKGIVFGLRYDAGFFLAFMLFRRVFTLWDITFQEVAKVFLVSGGCMLFLGFLVRYVFGESILTLL